MFFTAIIISSLSYVALISQLNFTSILTQLAHTIYRMKPSATITGLCNCIEYSVSVYTDLFYESLLPYCQCQDSCFFLEMRPTDLPL